MFEVGWERCFRNIEPKAGPSLSSHSEKQFYGTVNQGGHGLESISTLTMVLHNFLSIINLIIIPTNRYSAFQLY